MEMAQEQQHDSDVDNSLQYSVGMTPADHAILHSKQWLNDKVYCEKCMRCQCMINQASCTLQIITIYLDLLKREMEEVCGWSLLEYCCLQSMIIDQHCNR